jgi:hypothetical protein
MRRGAAPGGSAEGGDSTFVEVGIVADGTAAAVIPLGTERNSTCGTADGWRIAKSWPAMQHL